MALAQSTSDQRGSQGGLGFKTLASFWGSSDADASSTYPPDSNAAFKGDSKPQYVYLQVRIGKGSWEGGRGCMEREVQEGEGGEGEEKWRGRGG